MSNDKLTLVQQMIVDVCENVKSMLLEKNRKYGNAALDPVRIFSVADPVEQIRVRIDDKLSRIMEEDCNEDEDVLMDLIGYLVLLKIAENMDDPGCDCENCILKDCKSSTCKCECCTEAPNAEHDPDEDVGEPVPNFPGFFYKTIKTAVNLDGESDIDKVTEIMRKVRNGKKPSKKDMEWLDKVFDDVKKSFDEKSN